MKSMMRGAGRAAAYGTLITTLACVLAAGAQTCTTRATMPTAMLDAVSSAALSLATAVQANDAARVRASTIAEYAADFSSSEFLIRTTAPRLAGETLRVTSVFGLDATGRKAGAPEDAEFICALSGTSLEADFAIPSLPPGNYAFTMVEASGGTQPWLLAFLLRQEGGAWKMAGFYPHARTAAGHDGLWYWNEARAASKSRQPWAAYLLYAEAYALLKPVGFMTSSHLDNLVNEQRSNAPPELSNGIGKDTPLVVKGPAGEFHFTGLSADRSDDGARVHVALRLRAETADGAAVRVRNEAAAAAFVTAHPELKKYFQDVWVFADTDAQQPFVLTQREMSQIP